jgi:prepilin-type N-terminal cleavage/methylation domain-containing protein
MGKSMQAVGKTYSNSKDGFTLVEVIISMTLMAMVFTAAFGTYFLGMRMVEDAREEIRASQIVQSELESMRSMSWTDLSALPSLAPIKPTGNLINQFSQNYIAYRQVESISATKKRVSVWVWWKNSRGVYSLQIFSTFFSEGGLNDYYYRKV